MAAMRAHARADMGVQAGGCSAIYNICRDADAAGPDAGGRGGRGGGGSQSVSVGGCVSA